MIKNIDKSGPEVFYLESVEIILKDIPLFGRTILEFPHVTFHWVII